MTDAGAEILIELSVADIGAHWYHRVSTDIAHASFGMASAVLLWCWPGVKSALLCALCLWLGKELFGDMARAADPRAATWESVRDLSLALVMFGAVYWALLLRGRG